MTLQRESAQAFIFLERKQISRKESVQLFHFLFHTIVGNVSLEKKLDLLYLTRERILPPYRTKWHIFVRRTEYSFIFNNKNCAQYIILCQMIAHIMHQSIQYTIFIRITFT